MEGIRDSEEVDLFVDERGGGGGALNGKGKMKQAGEPERRIEMR